MDANANVVFHQLMPVIDEAIDIASSAVKSAEHARSQPAPEPVRLVKVAHARCEAVAHALSKSGSFNEYSTQSLTNTLKQGDQNTLLDLMEKLASRAVFPLDTDLLVADGSLVEKQASARETTSGTAESNADLWARCCEEVGLK